MKNNKVIAEFMGHHTYESNGYIMISYSDCNERTLQDTHYHTSWDWLMPVLNKIDSYANEKLSFLEFDDYRTNWSMIDRPSKYQIKDVYDQVVQFIEWYNKKNKQ
tara:strand:+ start:435 stop:749 length:315 start_codon:yes stop_codon:yes gene_type:complete